MDADEKQGLAICPLLKAHQYEPAQTGSLPEMDRYLHQCECRIRNFRIIRFQKANFYQLLPIIISALSFPGKKLNLKGAQIKWIVNAKTYRCAGGHLGGNTAWDFHDNMDNHHQGRGKKSGQPASSSLRLLGVRKSQGSKMLS
ncbi:hypothetical protein ACFL0M_06655 [Thermodesulfobacteriota bacterium]